MKILKNLLIGGGVLLGLIIALGLIIDFFDPVDMEAIQQEETIVRDSAYIADSIKNAEEIAVKQEAEEKQKSEEARKKLIEKQFSSWDGSHRKIVKYLKENMNDEDSFKHISTVYYDEKDAILVITKFSGKNGFGGTVKQTFTARTDIEGNIIEVVSLK